MKKKLPSPNIILPGSTKIEDYKYLYEIIHVSAKVPDQLKVGIVVVDCNYYGKKHTWTVNSMKTGACKYHFSGKYLGMQKWKKEKKASVV